MNISNQIELSESDIIDLSAMAVWAYEEAFGESDYIYHEIELISKKDGQYNLDCTSKRTIALFVVDIKRKHDDTHVGQKLFVVNKLTKNNAIGYLISTTNNDPCIENCITHVRIAL